MDLYDATPQGKSRAGASKKPKSGTAAGRGKWPKGSMSSVHTYTQTAEEHIHRHTGIQTWRCVTSGCSRLCPCTDGNTSMPKSDAREWGLFTVKPAYVTKQTIRPGQYNLPTLFPPVPQRNYFLCHCCTRKELPCPVRA